MNRATPKRPEDAGLLKPPDSRPLYLQAVERTVVFLDGPALRVKVGGQAERNLPLRRISRILANAHTQMSTEALLACAERGITIVFLSKDGMARARVLGHSGERQELRQRLLDLLDRPDWRGLYGDWRYAMERRAIIGVQRRLNAPEEVRTRVQFEGWLKRESDRLVEASAAVTVQRWLRELDFAWMVNHVRQLGLGGESELLQDGWPDVPGDLAAIHQWELEPVRIGWLRRRGNWEERRGKEAGAISRREVTALYERSGARLSRSGRELTNRLHRWLVELAR